MQCLLFVDELSETRLCVYKGEVEATEVALRSERRPTPKHRMGTFTDDVAVVSEFCGKSAKKTRGNPEVERSVLRKKRKGEKKNPP